MKLNDKQEEAVQHGTGPLLILAGAGSGKTRVIVHRIAHLIENKGIAPHRILAVTFTNKAADEMKERLRGLLPHGMAGLWVSTFHSSCLRILRQHIDQIGWPKDFVVYDDADHMALIKQCLKELHLDDKSLHPRAVASRIDAAKNELIDPSEFVAKAAVPTADFFDQKMAELYQLYQRRLRENKALDFGDLIFKTVLLLKESPRVRDYYQSLFQFVLIDEYQDTNHAQYELVRLLSEKHKNLCVVGDDDQSIYRWRGADLNNILEFERDYPGSRVIKLEQNYRSTPEILALAAELIRQNQGRKGKTLWTDNKPGSRATLLSASDEKEEVRLIITELKSLLSQGYRYTDCAIFYRTNAQSRLFEEELSRYKIPYQIFGGMRFYERLEVKDILSYIRVVINPQDSISLKRIINTPARGIGPKLLTELETFASAQGLSLFEATGRASEIKALSAAAQEKALYFHRLVSEWQKEMPLTGLADFVRQIAELSGYWGDLEKQKTVEAESRLENIEELLNVIDQFEDDEETPRLADFLDRISLVGDTDNFDPKTGQVSLMTLHLAKGLEFPVVFLVGLEEGIFPHQRSMDDPEELEEERRLCYVGLTRAKEKIYLSHALKRRLYGGDQYNMPSRFLEEMPPQLIERSQSEPKSRIDFDPSGFDDFDQRPATERLASKGLQSAYRIGITVTHPIFGTGVVKRREGQNDQEKVTVYFKDGRVKTLVTKFANLSILD